MPYSFGHICMILNEAGLTASLCIVGLTSTFFPSLFYKFVLE
jgi:hypothetical protein